MLILKLFWKDKMNYWTKSHQTFVSVLTRLQDVTKEEKTQELTFVVYTVSKIDFMTYGKTSNLCQEASSFVFK